MEKIKICEHVTITDGLFFDNEKDAANDVKKYRAYMSKFRVHCDVCGASKVVFQTHNA